MTCKIKGDGEGKQELGIAWVAYSTTKKEIIPKRSP